MQFIEDNKIRSFATSPKPFRSPAGKNGKTSGAPMTEAGVNSLLKGISSGKIASWDEVHAFTGSKAKPIPQQNWPMRWPPCWKCRVSAGVNSPSPFSGIAGRAVRTRKVDDPYDILSQRAKDYQNPFRKMVYDTDREMEKSNWQTKGQRFYQSATAGTGPVPRPGITDQTGFGKAKAGQTVNHKENPPVGRFLR